MIVGIGYALILAGLFFTATGVYSVLKFQDFYSRAVITSKVDTVGFTTVLIGAMLVSGANFFTLKIALILVFELLTTPLSTHAIAHSAYAAGYKVRRSDDV